MGVAGLWSLLSPIGKEINLESCKGKKLAVDLSAWVVQFSSVNTAKQISESYLCFRGIFMRTLNLLSLGISLVFVIDGPSAPALKKRKHREEFYNIVMEYKELLTALGLPVVESVGEAEKMCAELNHLNLVDGVLTNDGDALIYGAQIVYKGLLQERKDLTATVYHMEDVVTDLNLTKRDLVAFSLFSAGDFCSGVPKVREKKFSELMKEFKSNNIEDALERVTSWSSNTELDSLDNNKKSLIDNKRRHCTRCSHEGTQQEHKKSGCASCQIELHCKDRNTPGHPSCVCEYHIMEEAVKAHKTELKLRDLALNSNAHFPDQAVIHEFLDPLQQSLTDLNLTLCMPDFHAVCALTDKRLHFTSQQTMSHLIPATIKMAFHGLLPDLTIRPLVIIRECKVNFVKCFMIRWAKLDQGEQLSDDSCYVFKLTQALFSSKYPELVEQFLGTSSSATKRKQVNQKQTSVTSFFKTVKHSEPRKDQ